MTIYEYKCTICGKIREELTRDAIRPCYCGGLSKRTYHSVQIGRPAFQPHFNHAVGKYVSSWREFTDALKQGSDSNSATTGTDHNYQPHVPGDITPLDNGAGLEESHKLRRDTGVDPASTKRIIY